MKNLSFTGVAMLLFLHFTFAQSGTILPTQADFLNNSTSANVYAVRGVITSTTPGVYSAGVRGQNSGTGGPGVGVWGSHAGSGMGVYGTATNGTGVSGYTNSGTGVSGATTSGFGVFGNSITGTGLFAISTSGKAAVFNVSEGTNYAVDILHAGLGTGFNVRLNNTSNDQPAAIASHDGPGTGLYGISAGGNGLWGISSVAGMSGVIGENNSSGIGVKGRSVSGVGIHASSNSGTAAQVSSISGKAATFNVNEGSNSAVDITHAGWGIGLDIVLSNTGTYTTGIRVSNAGNGPGIVASSVSGDGVYAQAGTDGGYGIGGRFLNVNPASGANGLEGHTNGTGVAGYMRNDNSNGNGAGLVATKTNPYSAAYATTPNVDMEVRHPSQSTLGMTGLRILNTGTNKNNWTLYTANDNGALYLYANGVGKGNFSAVTGAYTNTSDRRLKNSISHYSPTLTNLMKIDVKRYRLNGSDKTEIGLMAQDVLAYFPEIVYTNNDDKGEQFYSMDYSRIGVLAVKALQEQQVVIEQQRAEIDTLKTRMAVLERLVEKSLKNK